MHFSIPCFINGWYQINLHYFICIGLPCKIIDKDCTFRIFVSVVVDEMVVELNGSHKLIQKGEVNLLVNSLGSLQIVEDILLPLANILYIKFLTIRLSCFPLSTAKTAKL
jgi:hypothetical protein